MRWRPSAWLVADWLFGARARTGRIKGSSATWRQDGRAVEAAGGKLPAGGAAATSFSTTYGEVAALPVAFRLNGTTCQAQMSVQAAPLPDAAPPQAKPKPKAEKVKAEKPKHHGDDEGDEEENDQEE